MVDGDISRRRVLVPLPTHHEATVRMARVLASEGVLAGLYVPMNTYRLDSALSRFASPDGRVRRFLDRWNHGEQAHSAAVVPEVLTACTFRLLATFGDARPASRLAGWRAEQIDRGIARRLRTQRPTTVLALQGFNRLVTSARSVNPPLDNKAYSAHATSCHDGSKETSWRALR